ncbi:hypothetical protein IWX49DRAFT_594844 [Phyllosticta citricarpa]
MARSSPPDEELERKLNENDKLSRASFQEVQQKLCLGSKQGNNDEASDAKPIFDSSRSRTRWEHMVEKLEAEAQKVASGEAKTDLIDLETMDVVEDRGHLHELPDCDFDLWDGGYGAEETGQGSMRGDGDYNDTSISKRAKIKDTSQSSRPVLPENDDHTEPKTTRRAWTDHDTKLIMDLRARGTSFKDIAEHFPGRTVGTIIARHKYIKDRPDEQSRWRVWTLDDNALLRSLRAQGTPYQEIAERLGRPTPQVISHYHRLEKKDKGLGEPF